MTGSEEASSDASEEPAGASPKDKLRDLLKFHLLDWVALVGLIVADVVLNEVHPFRRYINTVMAGSLSYPHKTETVPFWTVQATALLLPLSIMLVVYFVKKNIRDLHHGILGLVFTLAITALVTDVLKVAVGRPRPDFMDRCFPKGVTTWTFDSATGNVICSPDASLDSKNEGHKSFPSGHTAWSFAGLGYLSWYLAGKLRLYDKSGHSGKLPLVLSPLLLATLVAVSRVDDYRHHWQDVVVGGLLGFGVAAMVYHQHFPSIHALESGCVFVVRPAPAANTTKLSAAYTRNGADMEAGPRREERTDDKPYADIVSLRFS